MATSKKDSDLMFESYVLDPHMWVDQARSLKTSAQLSLDEIGRVQKLDLSPTDRSQRLLTLMQSYMLLSGFALENLIKGLIICRLLKKEAAIALSKKFFNHKLENLIPEDISISSDEKNLLLRLQTFTVWAGRYPIPKDSNDYRLAVSDSLMMMKSTDPALIDKLFFKIDQLILSESND